MARFCCVLLAALLCDVIAQTTTNHNPSSSIESPKISTQRVDKAVAKLQQNNEELKSLEMIELSKYISLIENILKKGLYTDTLMVNTLKHTVKVNTEKLNKLVEEVNTKYPDEPKTVGFYYNGEPNYEFAAQLVATLRMHNQNELANRLEQMTDYLKKLFEVKASGVYAVDSEMGKTLNYNLSMNMAKLESLMQEAKHKLLGTHSNDNSQGNEQAALVAQLQPYMTPSSGVFYSEEPTLDPELVKVVAKLRAHNEKVTAQALEDMANYVLNLEKVKHSGMYKGTEMEKTLDYNLAQDHSKLDKMFQTAKTLLENSQSF